MFMFYDNMASAYYTVRVSYLKHCYTATAHMTTNCFLCFFLGVSPSFVGVNKKLSL